MFKIYNFPDMALAMASATATALSFRPTIFSRCSVARVISLTHFNKHLTCNFNLTSSHCISVSGLRPIVLLKMIVTLNQHSGPSLTVFAAKGYKMKTHKASAKRFRVTGTGKIVRKRAGKQHLLAKKNTKRKLRLSKMVSPDGTQFSVTSPDRRIRVFWYRTGKLRRVYDESLEIHKGPVKVMKYNSVFDVVLSAEARGILEYWNPSTLEFPENRVNFRLKTDTDHFEILKCKTTVSTIEVSPDGTQFSVTSPDRRIRVFWYRTGKLRRVYDESLEVLLLMSMRARSP